MVQKKFYSLKILVSVFILSSLLISCDILSSFFNPNSNLISFWSEVGKQSFNPSLVYKVYNDYVFVDLTSGEDEEAPYGFDTYAEAENKLNSSDFYLTVMRDGVIDSSVGVIVEEEGVIEYPGDGYHALVKYHINNLEKGKTYEIHGKVVKEGNIEEAVGIVTIFIE